MKYAGRVRGVRTFNGSGGDGGVESIAELDDGKFIGLQCKWFRDGIRDIQVRQIKKSLARAMETYPSLAEYIVAIPTNLTGKVSPTKKTGSGRGRPRKSQTDRWDDFVEKFTGKRPSLRVTLWDEAQVLDLLTRPAGTTLPSFWFGTAPISIVALTDRFSVDRRGWLARRYSPDFHCAGRIESDLNRRLFLSPSAAELTAEADADKTALSRVVVKLDAMLSEDEDGLLAWKSETRAHVDELAGTCRAQARALQAGVGAIGASGNGDGALKGIAERWTRFKGALVKLTEEDRRHDGFYRKVTEYAKRIDRVVERARDRQSLINGFSKLVVYIGAAGSGKTHALAHLVESRLRRASPAVILQAREIDPKAGWGAALSRLLGVWASETKGVLEALESLAFESEISAARAAAEDNPPLVRALIVIDGLDEAGDWDSWGQRLSELAHFAEHYPRVQFVVSMRPQLAEHCLRSLNDCIERLELVDSDANIANLIDAYVPEVAAQPWLRLHLRNALAVRLFHDIGENGGLAWRNGTARTVDSLLRRKIDQVDAQERERLGRPASATPPLVYPCLLAALSAATSFGAEITVSQALRAINRAPDLAGALSGSEASTVLDVCADWGLLVQFRRVNPQRPGQMERCLAPAFQSITDFIVSTELAQRVATHLRAGRRPEPLPEELIWRSDVLSSALARVHAQGFSAFSHKIWLDDLHSDRWDEVVLTALSLDSRSIPLEAAEWVRLKLTISASSCHRIIKRLILPVAGDRDHSFGARFLHDVLMSLRLTDRDIVWSVPERLTGPSEAPWVAAEGNAAAEVRLVGDEPWDTVPIVAAWSTTSLHPRVRRRARAELAKWGAAQPMELLCLLEATIATNDHQMRSDLIVAVRGAASFGLLEGPRREPWAKLGAWLWSHFGANGAPYRTDDALLRYSLGEVLIRLGDAGIRIEGYDRRRPRVAGIDGVETRTVAFDVDAAGKPGPTMQIENLGYEFSRYVVDLLAGRFFKQRTKWPDAFHGREDAEGRADLHNFQPAFCAGADGRLPRLATVEARSTARSFVKKGKKRIPIPKISFRSVRSRDKVEKVCALPKPEHYLAPQALRLLASHAQSLGIESLDGHAFIRGAIWAHVLSLGWDIGRFRGARDGGSENEIIGLDIAILRQRSHVLQCELGDVLTCGEKYALLGLHAICGFLADRVPLDYGSPSDVEEPPVDLGRVFHFEPNPATDVLLACTSSRARPGLAGIPQITAWPDIGSGSQIERATRWIRETPAPDLESLVTEKTSGSQVLFRLIAFTSAPVASGLADALIWVSAMAVKPSTLLTLIEDADAGLLSPCGFSDDHASCGPETYSDPLDVLAPNHRPDDEMIRSYQTIDEEARPLTLKLLPMASRMHWREAEDVERERQVPVSWLRRALRIVSVKGASFIATDGTEVGWFDEQRDDDVEGSGYQLTVRGDALLARLESRGLRPIWFVRLLRQPATWLTLRHLDESWREKRDEEWLVWYEAGALKYRKLATQRES